MYYIYIVGCRDGSLYTGIAADIEKRLREHLFRLPACAKYTKSHPVTSLKALWTADSRSDASRLENLIKSLPRSRKQALIDSPDLLSDCFGERLRKSRYCPVPADEQKSIFDTASGR